jgi:hypothetical protein
LGRGIQPQGNVIRIGGQVMKTLSEATPQEILKRIDELDRKFWEVSPAERPFVAEAISILVQAHQKKVKA